MTALQKGDVYQSITFIEAAILMARSRFSMNIATIAETASMMNVEKIKLNGLI